MKHPTIDRSHLEHVKGLFGQNPEGVPLFRSNLEMVGSELALVSSTPVSTAKQALALARATVGYTGSRLSETFTRLSLLHWLLKQSESKLQASRLLDVYAGLVANDFHADAVTLMDSIAPVIILVDQEIKPEDRQKLPGFPDIQASSKRTYRAKLTSDLRTIVDATETWWPFVKAVRDITLHREHMRIASIQPGFGCVFQIYETERDGQPLVINPVLASAAGTQVADLSIYCTWVLAEIVYFFDQVSYLIADRFGIALARLDGGRMGNFQPFLEHLEQLLARTGQ